MSKVVEREFKIIIVDSNVNFRNNLASKLRLQGFDIELASGGFHLLHSLEKHWDFDLIIIHGNMEDMSAEEMISLVRTQKSRTDLPILYLSAVSRASEIKNMITIGANEYIVNVSDIQGIVERAKKYHLSDKK